MLQAPTASTAEPSLTYPMYEGRGSKRNRNVRNDDYKWKEDITRQYQELQAAQRATDEQTQRLVTENEALKKEFGRLTHQSQVYTGPGSTPSPPALSVQPTLSLQPPFICYNCSKPGHTSRYCREPRQPKYSVPNAQPDRFLRTIEEEPGIVQVNRVTKSSAGLYPTYLRATVGRARLSVIVCWILEAGRL